MHTFDPRMIERMMMRTSNGVLVKMVQTVIMTTIVQFSCNLLLPPHCGTLGNRLQEARFRRAKQTLARISRFLTSRQQVVDPRCDLSLRLQAPSFQAPDPSFRFQAVGPRLSGDPCRDPDQNCGGRRRQECHEPGHQSQNPAWRHP